jgi:hypothetical protein
MPWEEKIGEYCTCFSSEPFHVPFNLACFKMITFILLTPWDCQKLWIMLSPQLLTCTTYPSKGKVKTILLLCQHCIFLSGVLSSWVVATWVTFWFLSISRFFCTFMQLLKLLSKGESVQLKPLLLWFWYQHFWKKETHLSNWQL